MKNKKEVRRREFYIHQIVRDEKEMPEESEEVSVINKRKTLAENVGYRLDPSRYDCLRKNKPEQKTVSQIQEENDEQEMQLGNIVNNSYNQKSNDDEYLNDIANNYKEQNEDTTLTFEDNGLIDENVSNNSDSLKVNKNEFLKKPISKIESTPVQSFNDKGSHSFEPNPLPIRKKPGKYKGPSLDLLNTGSGTANSDIALAEDKKKIIDNILNNYGIHAHVYKYIFGPTVIQYLIEFESIDEDVKSLHKCEQNLAMYLSCTNLRIQTPIPGMCYAGIEVPRPSDSRGTVLLGDMLANKQFKKLDMHLPVAVGENNFGKYVYIDLADMPHGLCAGATKSGKSVCLNVFIMSLIYRFTPDDVRLVLMDPKRVEFGSYSEIPHLAMPVIMEQEYFEPAMQWLTDEMERRYKLLIKEGCKELSELNEQLVEENQPKIPYLVMIMDEFNDWFADCSATVDGYMTRLVQKARAAGIHILLATQRPSADVIKGTIKANVTTRLAFRVSSQADSVVILGQSCAEKLEGKGDMIIRHSGMSDTRLQCAFVSNKEIKAVTNFLRENNQVDYIVTEEELKQSSASRTPGNGSADPHVGMNDELFGEVAYFVVRNNNASLNQMQKTFGTGFNRMDAIFKDLTKLGVISPAVPGGRREVLINEEELNKILENN